MSALRREVPPARDEPPRAAAQRLAVFVRTGAPELLTSIYRATAEPLERLAWRVTQDHLAARDAVQEAFLDLLRVPTSFDPGRPAWPWLVGITINKAREIRRRTHRHRIRDEEVAGLAAAADDAIEELEIAERIWRTVEALPREHREVVLLLYRDGHTERQIAAQLDVPVSTVKSRLRTARARLRHSLGTAFAS